MVSKTVQTNPEFAAEIGALIRKQIGAIATLKKVYIVPRLPKTRSGKVLRKTMRLMLEAKHFELPSTIEDASVLDELEEIFNLVI